MTAPSAASASSPHPVVYTYSYEDEKVPSAVDDGGVDDVVRVYGTVDDDGFISTSSPPSVPSQPAPPPPVRSSMKLPPPRPRRPSSRLSYHSTSLSSASTSAHAHPRALADQLSAPQLSSQQSAPHPRFLRFAPLLFSPRSLCSLLFVPQSGMAPCPAHPAAVPSPDGDSAISRSVALATTGHRAVEAVHRCPSQTPPLSFHRPAAAVSPARLVGDDRTLPSLAPFAPPRHRLSAQRQCR